MEFNSLPLEVRLEIFSYLPVNDVMRMRRVCKQWNDLLNSQFKFKRLFCFQARSPGFVPTALNFKSPRIFLDHTHNDSKFSNKFSRVSRLVAILRLSYAELDDAFDFLNSFKFLNETVFECNVQGADHSELLGKTFCVRLNRLQKVAIFFSGETIGSKVSVLFDLPKLTGLVLDEFKSITIKHPKKLRTLAVSKLFQGLDYSKLTGLTRLYIDERDRQSITASFLENLPSLRELHLAAYYLHNASLLVDQLEPVASSKLRIFFYGFEFSQANLATEEWPVSFGLIGSNEDAARFIIRNRHRSVDGNQNIDSMVFNLLDSELDQTELFGVILRKFPKIRYLNVNGNVADANRLLDFVEKLKPELLHFADATLPQSFFSGLANNCSSFLQQLEFKTERSMNFLSGDFDFVFGLKNLVSLTFKNCRIPFNFVVRLVKELKQISLIQFSQPTNFDFQMNLCRCQNTAHHVIALSVDGEAERRQLATPSAYFRYEIAHNEALQFLNMLKSLLKFDGEFVSAKQLLVLLLQIRTDEQTYRFMARKYVYEQTRSIYLSADQMRSLLHS